MILNIESNRRDWQKEKDIREKRLLEYAEAIQKSTLEASSQIIKELVEERHRKGMTQQDIADITGILPSNLARFVEHLEHCCGLTPLSFYKIHIMH